MGKKATHTNKEQASDARALIVPSLLPVLAIISSLLLAAACGMREGRRATVSPPVQNLVATLEDQVDDLPGGRIRWSTYWRLCWADYPGAGGYDLQALTSEGASDRLSHQSDRCFSLEVAAGDNLKTQGLLNRNLQLAMRSSMLAYRVRAVLADGQPSEWSKPLSVAEASSNGTQSKDRSE
jgi:hypothetical protein